MEIVKQAGNKCGLNIQFRHGSPYGT
jgi:hypothetical protein